MCETAAKLAVKLHMGIVRTGGATLTLAQCDHGEATLKVAYGAQPEGGYMVAVFDEPLATTTLETWDLMAAHNALIDISENELCSRFLFGNPFAGLGFWVDPATHMIQLDAVEMYQDRTVALTLASARGQKAIYDLALGQDVLVR